MPGMRYVALLRGINVGGKSLVRMADLKECVEELGYDDVSTFIASGNVLFETAERNAAKLESAIERALEKRFRLPITVVVRSRAEVSRIVKAIPPDWIGNGSLRVNVAFLRRAVDGRKLARELEPREGVDELVATKSALIWATRRDALTRSGMQKLIRGAAYKDMTVRNLNTTLKLQDLLAGLRRLGVDHAEEPRDRRRPSADAELGVDVLEVLANRARREPEQLGDLGVRLPLGDPAHYLGLARRQLDPDALLAKHEGLTRSLDGDEQLPAPAAERLGRTGVQPPDEVVGQPAGRRRREECGQQPASPRRCEFDLVARSQQHDAALRRVRRCFERGEGGGQQPTRPRRVPEARELWRQELEDARVADREVAAGEPAERKRLAVPRR